MSELNFTAALAEIRPDAGAWRAPLPSNWLQGRTAYGGYTAAIMLAAAMKAAPEAPGLRSALVNFTGPVTAPPMLRPDILRQGRNVTTIAARAEVEGAPAALATFSFGAARESAVEVELNAPPAAEPEDLETFFPPAAERLVPAFAHQFEVRLISGARPYSGAAKGHMEAWIRHKDPAARTGQLGLLCLADMLPPAVYPMLQAPAINSSMTWICNFLTDDFTTEDGWWRVETTLSAARDGYASQVMRIWDRSGRLSVDGMQAVAIFA